MTQNQNGPSLNRVPGSIKTPLSIRSFHGIGLPLDKLGRVFRQAKRFYYYLPHWANTQEAPPARRTHTQEHTHITPQSYPTTPHLSSTHTHHTSHIIPSDGPSSRPPDHMGFVHRVPGRGGRLLTRPTFVSDKWRALDDESALRPVVGVGNAR